MAVEVRNMYKHIKRKKTILNNISLSVKKGSFVAIVGCSGAGKTSLMKVLSGYSSFDDGEVYIENINIKNNLKYLNGKIGYVPQAEILDGSLTLFNSLYYSLNLRTKKINKDEDINKINNILKFFELEHAKDTLIKNLSGGEKKRASIATEMLSNPSIFLLDEPTSSLDANIEKKLMLKLKELTTLGKTVIITAHTVSNLYLCDKIIFMGTNGRICYDGKYEDIFKYFGVDEFVDIYDLLKNNTDYWHNKYLENIHLGNTNIEETNDKKIIKFSFIKQTNTLIKRYVSSLLNNKFMLALLFGQPILMGLMMCFSTNRDVLTNPLSASVVGAAAFSLAAIWLGLFNTIQEISKERDMLKKESMSGLKFSSYIYSKVVIFSILCLYQSIVCTSIVYYYLDPRPSDILFTTTLIDLIFNFFLVSFSTSMVGIFISSIVNDLKISLIIAPLYMMFQMLFSGMFIPFVKITKAISYLVIGRWSYESFGTINNLYSFGVITSEEGFFEFTKSHVLNIWYILILIIIIFLLLSIFSIKKSILNQK